MRDSNVWHSRFLCFSCYILVNTLGKKFPWMQLIWEKDNFFSLVRCSSKVCHMVNSSSLQCCPARQNESASSIHTCGGFTY